ncbi:MFS transporter [Enterococcus sp. OL5]|uniref:MFS transporter n=1 Tax=Enterococcus sp. OL5 TaxID=2590214 RepID=UPI0011276848|nr:MFS transporter [Enterococcus sp. OL5]TPR55575.1 hypothetical protein FJU10_16355 [Enterococcus sp. OL5]
MEKSKSKEQTKIGPMKFFSWVIQGTSLAVQFVVLGYLMMYCTSALGLNAGVVGTVLLVTKIMDGVVDLFFGMIIDRTNTKWGRGRPYDLFIILLWGSTWALFSVPLGLSNTLKYLWIFVFYTLAMSVARSLMQAAGLPYQVRAFNNEQIYNKINGYGGILSIGVVMLFNMKLPGLLFPILSDASAWSRITLMIAIPMTILGLLRFFTVKEVYDDIDSHTDVVKFKDILALFKMNKNILPLFLFQLTLNITTGLSLNTYYYQYVTGDLSVMGTLAIFGMVPMVAMIFFPTILKKVSVKHLIQLTSLSSIITSFCLYFFPKNFVALAIAGIFWGFSSLAGSYMFTNMLIDAANYNEWKGMPRMEGVIAGVNSFFNNTGSAIGTFAGGIILTIAGLQSGIEVQTPETIAHIKVAFALVPTIGMLLASALLFFYKIDDVKPQMMSDLEKKREASQANAAPDAVGAVAMNIEESE